MKIQRFVNDFQTLTIRLQITRSENVYENRCFRCVLILIVTIISFNMDFIGGCLHE
jgi:hypothetical protein